MKKMNNTNKVIQINDYIKRKENYIYTEEDYFNEIIEEVIEEEEDNTEKLVDNVFNKKLKNEE